MARLVQYHSIKNHSICRVVQAVGHYIKCECMSIRISDIVDITRYWINVGPTSATVAQH